MAAELAESVHEEELKPKKRELGEELEEKTT